MLLNFHYRQSQISPFMTYRAGRAYPHRFVGGAQERPWQEPISLMGKKKYPCQLTNASKDNCWFKFRGVLDSPFYIYIIRVYEPVHQIRPPQLQALLHPWCRKVLWWQQPVLGWLTPYPFADGNIVIVQGKPIDEQGDEGFFGTSSRSSNQEKSYPPPSNPRLDGQRIYTAMQKYPSFIHRPALGWTVTKRVFSIHETNKKCTRSLLS